jgi:ribulose-phosphate 3-epimerase
MIIPAILEDSPEMVAEQLDRLRQLQPPPEIVEIDIIDGDFAPNLTIDTEQLSELETQPFQLDVHLMTLDPTDLVYQIRQGMERGQVIRTVIAQVERLHSFQEFVEEVQANHFQVGFALDLYTPVEAIEQQWWPEIQLVSVLGGMAGQQGQEFQAQTLEKVKELAQLKQEQGLTFEIRVDIGMDIDTIPQAKTAGANSFAVGSRLKKLRGDAQQEKWEKLWEALE